MPRSITIIPTIPRLDQKKRVAAYARVSSGKDAMLHSLSAQVSYYSELIQQHPGWLYCGVYSDEAKTGTKDSRDGFQQLLADCRVGKLDMVVTKSISRFARNTVTLLETVRELKDLGVDVFFEEQGIHTTSGDGELMMTILASYAQEESLSASENIKWRVKENFAQGIPWNYTLYGYRNDNGVYSIVPSEAAVIREIYAEYLSGMGISTITKKLIESDAPTRCGGRWCGSTVSQILRNYTYTGSLLLQKTYRENHLTKFKRENNGELPQYHAAGTHETIISTETFIAVQDEIKRRAEKHRHSAYCANRYPFSGRVICGCCGSYYHRKVLRGRASWMCNTYDRMGKAHCASKQVPEEVLLATAADILGLDEFDEGVFCASVVEILVKADNVLVFRLHDGSDIVRQWQDRSRRDSWTDEMKAAARQKTIERNAQRCQTSQ